MLQQNKRIDKKPGSERNFQEAAGLIADLHVHTRYSPDSLASVESVFKAAAKKGVGAIAVTDHDSCGAWEKAREWSRKTGILFVPGVEVSAVDEQENLLGHVLCLFLSEPVKSRALPDLYDEVRGQGGIVSVAHPFDHYRYGMGKRVIEFLGYYDAVEAFNSHSRSPEFDAGAREFAERERLPVTAGSDAHVPQQVGMGRIIADAGDLEGLKKKILERRVSVEGEYRGVGLKLLSGAHKTIKRFWH